MALRRIDLLAEARPLKPVARPFDKTRIAARLFGIDRPRRAERIAHRAGDIAEAAADLHRIGRYDPSGPRRTVGEPHEGAALRRKTESAQIDPCAAAHRLIHRETALAAGVPHRVARIVRTPGLGPIGDIDRIIARLGHLGRPHGFARRTALRDGPHTAHRAALERILSGAVKGLPVGESRAARRPRLVAGALLVLGARPIAVVVDDPLVFLHVPLARQQHVRPCVFEHRDQVLQHVALRVEVFARPPERRALPAPAVLRLVEVTAVALPQGDMTVLQPRIGPHGRIEPLDQRPRRAIDEAHDAAPCGSAPFRQRDQLLDGPALGEEFDPRLAVLRRQAAPHRVVHRTQILLAERVIRKTDGGMDAHPGARRLDPAHAHPSAGDLAVRDPRQRAGDLPPGGGRHPLVRGGEVRSGDRRECDEEAEKNSIFHGVSR